MACRKEVQALGNAEGSQQPAARLDRALHRARRCGAARQDNSVDLTGLAKIRWETKVSGFHKVRPMVKLADGTWLVGDHADGSTLDWHDNEFSVSEVRWLKLKIDKVVTKGNWVENPDLSKVDEVGFTDLLPRQRTRPRRMVRRSGV